MTLQEAIQLLESRPQSEVSQRLLAGLNDAWKRSDHKGITYAQENLYNYAVGIEKGALV